MSLALRLPSIRFPWKQDPEETGLRDVRKRPAPPGLGAAGGSRLPSEKMPDAIRHVTAREAFTKLAML